MYHILSVRIDIFRFISVYNKLVQLCAKNVIHGVTNSKKSQLVCENISSMYGIYFKQVLVPQFYCWKRFLIFQAYNIIWLLEYCNGEKNNLLSEIYLVNLRFDSEIHVLGFTVKYSCLQFKEPRFTSFTVNQSVLQWNSLFNSEIFSEIFGLIFLKGKKSYISYQINRAGLSWMKRQTPRNLLFFV